MKKLLLVTKTLLITTFINAQTVTEFVTGLTYPLGLAIDENNQLYVGDVKKIYKLDSDGSKNLFIEGEFSNDYLMFDAEGNLLSTDGGLGKTIKISSSGKTIEEYTNGFDGNFVFDTQKNIYYKNAGTVYKKTPKGIASVFVEGFTVISEIAINTNSDVYVVDEIDQSITKIGKDGKVIDKLSDLILPTTIAIDKDGNIYFDERSGTNGVKDIDLVSKYNFKTKKKEVFGKEEIKGAIKQIIFDQNNVVFVSCDNGVIYKIENQTLSNTDFPKEENNSFLSPNPTNGLIALDNTIKSVDIYDLQGKLVYQNSTIDKKIVDVSDLAIGIYSVHMTDLKNQKSLTKLVKK